MIVRFSGRNVAFALMVSGALLGGCDRSASPNHQQPGHEDVELAEPMSRLHYYSQKLGFAIQAENEQLADFYLHEMEELNEDVQKTVPEYEGHPIAELMKGMFEPALEAQEAALASGDWSQARRSYSDMIQTCNSCHIVTDHGFIRITPAEGVPPFNQDFSPE